MSDAPAAQPNDPATTPPAAAVAPVDPAAPPAQPAAPAAPGAAATPPAPPAKPWFQTRIDAVTREKYEAIREKEQATQRAKELEAEVARLRGVTGHPAPAAAVPQPQQPVNNHNPVPPQPVAPAQPQFTQAEIEERAAQLANERSFVDACNKVYNDGKAAHGQEFETAVGNLKMLGSDTPQYRNMLEAAVALENSPDVLKHLGSNMDEASRIMSLPPVRMAVELAKLGTKVAAAPKVSNAPAPVDPIGGGSVAASPAPTSDGEFKDQAAYKAWREKQFKRR